jgi:hypothetical protein
MLNVSDIFNAVDLVTVLTIIAALLFILVYRRELRKHK